MLVKVGQRGQVTIPKKIRDELGIVPGSGIVLTVKDGELIVEVINQTLFDMVGSIDSDTAFSLDEMDEAAKRRVAKRHKR